MCVVDWTRFARQPSCQLKKLGAWSIYIYLVYTTAPTRTYVSSSNSSCDTQQQASTACVRTPASSCNAAGSLFVRTSSAYQQLLQVTTASTHYSYYTSTHYSYEHVLVVVYSYTASSTSAEEIQHFVLFNIPIYLCARYVLSCGKGQYNTPSPLLERTSTATVVAATHMIYTYMLNFSGYAVHIASYSYTYCGSSSTAHRHCSYVQQQR